MKYIFACLIVPVISILYIAAFGFGALYYFVMDLQERIRPH